MNFFSDPPENIIKKAVRRAEAHILAKRPNTLFYPSEQNVKDWLAGKTITPKTKKSGELQPFRSKEMQDLAFFLAFFYPFMKTHLQHRTFKLSELGNWETFYTPDFYVEYQDNDGLQHRTYLDLISDVEREIPTVHHTKWCLVNGIEYIQISTKSNMAIDKESHFAWNIRKLYPYRFYSHPCLPTLYVPLSFAVQEHLLNFPMPTYGSVLLNLQKLEYAPSLSVLKSLLNRFIAKGQILIDLHQPIMNDSPLSLRSSNNQSHEPFFSALCSKPT